MSKKNKNSSKIVPLKKSQCPMCGKPSLDQTRPFCSSRCANLDLGRWLDGKYRILTDETSNDVSIALLDDEKRN